MAGVIAAAAVFGPSPAPILIAIAYVVGASIPLAAIGVWGRRRARDRSARSAGRGSSERSVSRWWRPRSSC